MVTRTNAVKSLSDEVVFSLSGSKCTVSARFLHGFKTCKGCKSLQNRTKGAETPNSKFAKYRLEMTLKRNFKKLRESPGVRYESVGRGFESLPSHQEKPVHIVCWFFFLSARWKGLEQGSAASNQPSGLLLSPRVPTRRNVYRGSCKSKDFMAFLFCKPWVRGCGKSETYLQKIQDGKDGISY